MSQDVHNDARKLMALGDEITEAERKFVRSHLEQCADCRLYGDAMNRAVASLRAVPVVADARLVRATQMRVRFHASHLREARQRSFLLAAACLGVGLSATLTIPLLWQLFEWIGEQAGVSAPVWQSGFVLFWIAPALAVSILLLLRGSHLRSAARSRHWR